MTRIASFTVWIYSQGLRLYPGSFHRSFGMEMRDVFTMAVADAVKCGVVAAIGTVMKELGELPQNIVIEHTYERRKRLIQSFDSPQELLLGGVEMLEKPLVAIGYLLLIAAFIGFLVVVVMGLVDALPWGVVGLLLIAGLGVLLVKVIKDTLTSEEDRYYSKKVKQ